MTLPYTEIDRLDNQVVRIFDETVDPIELMWHRDDEDRIIEAVGQTDWFIQLENELPRAMNCPINISRHEWHRVIKGTGSLTVKITKM